MTLLDAPRFDEAADRRKRITMWSCCAVFCAIVIAFWIAAGYPIDWPWNWLAHMRGRATINRFLTDVEKNDLTAAYGVWMHDPSWQQHVAQLAAHPYSDFLKQQGYTGNSGELDPKSAQKYASEYGKLVGMKNWRNLSTSFASYPFSRFQQDWSSSSPDNDYGAIKNHQIVAARINGNVLVVGIIINNNRAKPLFLAYDPNTETLTYSPVELYLGP
jgi:hypothetical protein